MFPQIIEPAIEVADMRKVHKYYHFKMKDVVGNRTRVIYDHRI